MTRDILFVLVHSPLVGPLIWSLVAGEMQQRGLPVLVPTVADSPGTKAPFWQQHAESVSQAWTALHTDSQVILVAHSGAGPLLPAIRHSIPNPVHAYVFVDAGLPRNHATRLDLMKSEDAAWAAQFEADLERGGLFPTWSFDDLKEVIPDQKLRAQMVDELRPRGVSFFMEPIPVFAGWPDAPCIYIQFSPPYQKAADQARQAGWITHHLEAGHFHMLVDAKTVTDLIVDSVNMISPRP